MFTLVTIAVPGIMLACGYIFAWNAPYLQNIGIGGSQGVQFYGTIWLLLAAYIGGSLPYATRLGIGALDQVGQNMLETARVQGANIFSTLTEHCWAALALQPDFDLAVSFYRYDVRVSGI